MTAYFLIYHQVWEHHYVMLLPVLVVMYQRKASPLVLGLFCLIAIWTPYRLFDPGGLAASDPLYALDAASAPLARCGLSRKQSAAHARPVGVYRRADGALWCLGAPRWRGC